MQPPNSHHPFFNALRFFLLLVASALCCMPAGAVIYTVTNVNDAGVGSLRQAILNANAHAGADQISFNIPGTGAHTISPATALPMITDPVLIDGSTQPGYAGMPVIELDGTHASYPGNGLDLTAGSSTVRGLAINRFIDSEIVIETKGGNSIKACFIGTDVTGMHSFRTGGTGLAILSDGNIIGGGLSGDRNVISGNPQWGIYLANATFNIVQGNFIGTDVTGTTALGNQNAGIIVNGCGGTVIGGGAPGARNIISANVYGVWVLNSAPFPDVILGNYIGTDITGSRALGNTWHGIYVLDATGPIIGGSTFGAGNVISANGLNGIHIEGTDGSTVQGNLIGLDSKGFCPLGNSGNGILIRGSNNVIGGTKQGTGNTVAYNGVRLDGVGIRVGSGAGNAIFANSIYSNTNIGIDLGDANTDIGYDGPTANDASGHTGPNLYQNYPVITAASFGYGPTTIQAKLTGARNATFFIQFYASPKADATGFGQGKVFIGSASATTDGSGNANIHVSLPAVVPINQVLCATATDAQNNTSEFSPSYPGLNADGPILTLSSVPPFGSDPGTVTGRAFHVDPASYRVALLILIPGLGWYSKPYANALLTSMQSDGRWSASITTGGVDPTATQIAAYLLPASASISAVLGADSIPDYIEQQAVAKAARVRVNPNQRIVHFSSFDWFVKSNSVPIGPGLNYFSDSTDNVHTDAQGRLHLRITNRNGKWYCPEIICTRSLGYGTYRFHLVSPAGALDPNAVLGLFTWSDSAANNHREIDIEISRWGDPNNQNAQYVVQPFSLPQNLHRFQIDPALGESTHSFHWQSDKVEFESTNSTILQRWPFSGPGVPPQGDEKPHMNLWLLGGQAPMNGQEAEVIIDRFEFQADYTPADLDGDGKPDLLFQNRKTGLLAYWLMNGSILLNLGLLSPADPGSPDWVLVDCPDLNGDGKPDLLFQNRKTGLLAYWLMNGAKLISLGLLNPADPGSPDWIAIGCADFNGDGKPDVLFQNRKTGLLAYWLMNGTSLISLGLITPNDPGSRDWQVVGIADLDQDGSPDLIFQNQQSGMLVYWLMNGTQLRRWDYFSPSDPGSLDWRVVAVSDLNGDRKPDLLFQNQRTGILVYWQMDGPNLVLWDFLNPSDPGSPDWTVVAPH